MNMIIPPSQSPEDMTSGTRPRVNLLGSGSCTADEVTVNWDRLSLFLLVLSKALTCFQGITSGCWSGSERDRVAGLAHYGGAPGGEGRGGWLA